jgi:hypothetical protein
VSKQATIKSQAYHNFIYSLRSKLAAETVAMPYGGYAVCIRVAPLAHKKRMNPSPAMQIQLICFSGSSLVQDRCRNDSMRCLEVTKSQTNYKMGLYHTEYSSFHTLPVSPALVKCLFLFLPASS